MFGEDGTPGCQADGQKETKKWELEGELRGENEILIDFSKKGGTEEFTREVDRQWRFVPRREHVVKVIIIIA